MKISPTVIFIFGLSFLVGSNMKAQVGIGTITPHSSAVLDVESTTKGFLPPRLTTSERDAINSGTFTEGLVIYNSDIKCIEFYNNAEWVNVCGLSTGPNLPEPPTNIESIPDGSGSLSSRYCFDIAESNDLIMGAGSLLQRKYSRADFNQTTVNTQTLRFTSTNPVSNLIFYAVDPNGNIISSFTPDADYSANGSLTEATAQIVYKTTISSPDPVNPTSGTALGLHVSAALRPTYYVVYQDQINGGGTQVKRKFSPSIRDSQCSTNQTMGSQSSHFLTSTGDVYGIGVGSNGYLGTGNTNSQNSLTQVAFPEPIVALVNGWEHSFALDNTGELFGWGLNTSGQVGVGGSSTHTSPVQISLPNGEKAIQITASWNISMVLTDANNIYGWGLNHAPGNFGTSATTNPGLTTPTLVTIPVGVTPVSIMNGYRANFFLGDDGILYSCGHGDLLGRTSTPQYEFKEVLFPNNVKVHTVASTGPNAMAIGTDNEIYVWGKNRYGELIYGAASASSAIITTPQKINLPSEMGTPVQLFRGYYSTFILDDQNKLFASGWNPYGNLGTDTIAATQNLLKEVVLPSGVIPVDVLTFYSIAYVVASDGKIYSAGEDTSNNKLQRTVDASHPKEQFHLCSSPVFDNNSIIPN